MFMLILVAKFESDYPQNYTNTLSPVLLSKYYFCLLASAK